MRFSAIPAGVVIASGNKKKSEQESMFLDFLPGLLGLNVRPAGCKIQKVKQMVPYVA